MGKFSGYLICSDVDGTLIDDNFQIPKANLEAIRYFQSEGGYFTLATGRTPQGAEIYIDTVKPNAPLVCQNGAGIYDFTTLKYLWTSPLDTEAFEVIDYVVNKFPHCGVEVLCESGIYYVKENAYTTQHMENEKFDVIRKEYSEIKDPWLKILFAEERSGADVIQNHLQKSSFAKKYNLVRSYRTYYEVLDKNTNKGKAGEILSLDKDKMFTIGDNDNDAEMLGAVLNSYAVKNASPYAKECAKYTLEKDNNEGAIDTLVKIIESRLR